MLRGSLTRPGITLNICLLNLLLASSMCCDQGQGKYEVFMDFMGDSPVASGGEFDANESHFFGDCSDGPQTSKPTGEVRLFTVVGLSPLICTEPATFYSPRPRPWIQLLHLTPSW